MNIPSSIFVGYFPKITVQNSDLKDENGSTGMKNKVVEEICSVSECISEAPEGWVDKWKHNDLGFYDTEESALSVISDKKEKYDLYAYKLYPVKFEEDKVIKIKIDSNAVEHLKAYEFIGYDVVSSSEGHYFECSPLSCNDACEIFPVNRYCLIQDFNDALECCRKISEENTGAKVSKRPDGVHEYRGKWEPGPYYVFQVFRKNK